LIRSHPYASINWIRFIGLTSGRRLSALQSTPLRRHDYITSEMPTQAAVQDSGLRAQLPCIKNALSLASKGYLGRMPAKVAPKRQKAPFGPSLESLGARDDGPRHPCLATLLQPFSRGSHQPLRGETGAASRAIKAGCRKSIYFNGSGVRSCIGFPGRCA
jgi:hypothetical protein